MRSCVRVSGFFENFIYRSLLKINDEIYVCFGFMINLRHRTRFEDLQWEIYFKAKSRVTKFCCELFHVIWKKEFGKILCSKPFTSRVSYIYLLLN